MRGLDEAEEQIIELVHEYGTKKTFDIVRANYGRWARCRELLEADRLATERLRWENGGSIK